MIPVCGESLADPGRLYAHLQHNFSAIRSYEQPEEKSRVRQYIYDFLSDLASRHSIEVLVDNFDVVSCDVIVRHVT